MQLGKVKGNVTATAKAERLNGLKLLVVDVVDHKGNVLSSGQVAADTVGAGVGYAVILTKGTAARLSAGLSSAPVDLAIVAVIDHINA